MYDVSLYCMTLIFRFTTQYLFQLVMACKKEAFQSSATRDFNFNCFLKSHSHNVEHFQV